MRSVILLALVGAAFAVPKMPTRIVGGEATTVEQYPFMSNMLYLSWGGFWTQWCGGALLTTQTVLSAAHCYAGRSPSEWRVRFGSSFASSGGVVHEVNRLVVHEEYDSWYITNDVAIVWLNTPVTLTANIGLARIAGLNYNMADGTVVYAIGWGRLSTIGSYPEQLRHVDVNIINHEVCTQRYADLKAQPGYGSWPDVTPSMLCTGILDIGGKDACTGDSGGPVVHDGDVVVGVISWGQGCADPLYPGVSTRVSYFVDWIVTNAST